MVSIKIYPYKGRYKAKIEGDVKEIVDILRSMKNSPEGEWLKAKKGETLVPEKYETLF